MVQLSHLYTTTGKIIVLTIQTFVSKVMSLLFNMLSRLVITSVHNYRSGKIIVLTIQTFVGKLISQLFKTLSRSVTSKVYLLSKPQNFWGL